MFGEVRDLVLADWRRLVDVNLWGVVHGVAAAYAAMARQGSGHIVNIASAAGLMGYPMMTPYVTTKFAVVGLSINLRAEGEALGVKVSVVCPGLVDTPIHRSAPFVRADREPYLARLPFRFVDVGEAARLILRGVARNRAVIVFPLYARVCWWLYRLNPRLIAPLGRRAACEFRAVRDPDGT